jgi:hypothetical protein
MGRDCSTGAVLNARCVPDAWPAAQRGDT